MMGRSVIAWMNREVTNPWLRQKRGQEERGRPRPQRAEIQEQADWAVSRSKGPPGLARFNRFDKGEWLRTRTSALLSCGILFASAPAICADGFLIQRATVHRVTAPPSVADVLVQNGTITRIAPTIEFSGQFPL